MSNDYRNRDRGQSWYYSDEKRYVPSGKMNGGRPRVYRRVRPYPASKADMARRRASDNAHFRYNNQTRAEVNRLTRSGRIAKGVFITSLSLLIIILFVVAGVYVYVQENIFGQMTFIDASQDILSDNYDDILIEPDEEISEDSQLNELTEEEVNAIDKIINSSVISEENLYRQEGVTNILILGTDNRSHSIKGSRTDAMIILSINEHSRELIMTSIQRDSYVYIPGRSKPNKINAAHAYGCASLAVKTVESNFGIDIDRYAIFDFYAFMDVIDAFGGIRLDITENERLVMNNYITEINNKLGLHEDSGKLYTSGNDLLLTGKQALGYVRNRYTGNGDFARSTRQRIVMEKLIDRCRNSSLTELIGAVEAVAPHITTNLSQSEIMSLASSALEYIDYNIISNRVPIDGTWEYATVDGMSIVRLELAPNRQDLIDVIYGESN